MEATSMAMDQELRIATTSSDSIPAATKVSPRWGGEDGQDTAQYKEPVGGRWENRVSKPVRSFVEILLIASKQTGPRVNQADDTPQANAKSGREPSMVRDG